MEQNPQLAIIIPKAKAITDPFHHDHHDEEPRSGKKRNPFKVALFKMRSGSRKSKVLPVDDVSRSVWKKLVGSMRPLHLQGNQSPRPIHVTLPSPPSPSPSAYSEDALTCEEGPYSPSPPSSLYASALGLNELDQGNEEEEEKREELDHIAEMDKDNRDGDGDEMIDAKAEEFIAQFYQQMRLQRLDSIDLRYQERSERSIA